MSDTSSARPDDLIAYGATMYLEAEFVLEHNRVRAKLDRLYSSSSAYVGPFADVQTEVETAVRLCQELDVWVSAVGQAFLEAGGGTDDVVTAEDAELIGLMPPGLADPPAETREKAEEGADLFEQLKAAADDRDHDRLEELLEELEDRQDDPAFMAGFATKAEELLGSLDEIEGMIEDGMRPKNRDGFWGSTLDFFEGAWDSIWGGLTMLHGLTTQLVFDPGKWANNWGNLGKGLWEGITNPVEFLKSLVDFEGLKDNPQRWLGSFVPDLAVTIFSGGAGATIRATKGLKGLDALADIAETARDLERIADGVDPSDLPGGARRGLDLDADLANVADALRQSLLDRGYPPAVADRIADRVASGTQFNRDNWDNYAFNEVRLTNGKVLDSYDPIDQEIVSRKFTQLADIQLSTAQSYIRELVNKYPAGSTIADSPSMRSQVGPDGRSIAGQQITGDLILEIPAQLDDVPEAILRYARQRNVIIRDTEGRVLT